MTQTNSHKRELEYWYFQMIIQSLGSGCEKSQSPSEMLHFALVISFANCFTFVAAANCCSSIKCAGKTKCPNLGTCAPNYILQMSTSIYLHDKRKYQVKDTKEQLQRELQTTLGVCFFNCLCKLNVKMKHGMLPGNIIENLPFPFSCPVTEFHKDILAVQGHHQLKTLYLCVDVRMPLWQIHK